MATSVTTSTNQKLMGISKSAIASICELAGFVSIVASIGIWFLSQGDGSAEALAHAERFGIFVGLWAPTLFILANKYGREGRN